MQKTFIIEIIPFKIQLLLAKNKFYRLLPKLRVTFAAAVISVT